MEDVDPPLPLTTPLLLVKPPVGLSTPEVFRALDLARRSTADPLDLLRGLAARGAIDPELCVNDLEQPAFDVLPSLAQLKQRLIADSDGRFSAVFMTGALLASNPDSTTPSAQLHYKLVLVGPRCHQECLLPARGKMLIT